MYIICLNACCGFICTTVEVIYLTTKGIIRATIDAIIAKKASAEKHSFVWFIVANHFLKIFFHNIVL